MAREVDTEDDYRSKLLKLIPSEIIGAYTVAQGIVPTGNSAGDRLTTAIALSIVGGVLVVCTPIVLGKLYGVRSQKQIWATVGSFLVWMYSLGGPFQAWGTYAMLPIYKAWAGSIVLVLWTTMIPLLTYPSGAPAAAPAGKA
jgi:hypothetical protein